ncbi:MAG TPA: GNAT family N-acetyltransferase, partial [Kofleriaceae bacterium]|nr:GNAT family N-acetyltransferase [Kofleriaceae bacterium]
MTAPARHFTADYVERAILRDGTAVRLRLVTPEDKPLLLAGFQRMSPASRYARFLGPKDTLSADELRYLTEIDQERHFALGAVTEDGDGHGAPIGAGVARFIRLPEPPATAEAAVAVADELQGRGLGKLLFMRLCAAARERGIERFRCEVLGSNTGMRNLIEAVSPDRRIEA